MRLILGLVSTVLAPILLGGFLIGPFQPFTGLSGWLAAGTVAGLTIFTALCFVFALIGKISWLTIGLSLATFAMLTALVRRRVREEKTEIETVLSASLRVSIVSLVIRAGLALLLVASMVEVLRVTAFGYEVGFIKNFGDLSFHLHLLTSFLYADNLPPQNPIFSGVPLRYSFLCDLYSAVVYFASGSLEGSLEWPGLLLGLAFLILLGQWLGQVTRSKLAATLGPLLFFLNGSCNGWMWFKDLWSGSGSAGIKDWLPRMYTMMADDHYVWANILHALWIPQRGLQFALPLFVLFLGMAPRAVQAADRRSLGVLAFVLAAFPFFHGHAAMALAMVAIVFALLTPSRSWLWFGVPLAVAWLPQFLYLGQILGTKVPDAPSFIRWNWGWDVQGFGAFWFWLKNTGPLIPLCIYGAWLSRREGRVAGAGALALFIVGNFVMLAPWHWDNIKILVFAFLLCLPLASLALARLFEAKQWPLRIAAVVFLIMLTLTGALDLAHALRPGGENHMILNAKELRIAAWIRENTPKKAVILAGPTFNQPIVMTGRTMFLGYTGHVWSHGLPLAQREREVRIMGHGEPGALVLLQRYGITHVMVGAKETVYEFDRDFLEKNLTYQGSVEHTLFYQVPPATTAR